MWYVVRACVLVWGGGSPLQKKEVQIRVGAIAPCVCVRMFACVCVDVCVCAWV